MTTLSLRQIRLRSGEEYRDTKDVELGPFELGGQRYLTVPGTVPADLTITRASTGSVFGLSFRARVHGPCYRCLADAVVDIPISAREYQATNPAESEELTTPYVHEDQLELSAWARDAVALALPDKILCRADCAGLCPVCGRDLNVEPHTHAEAEGDPRWSVLADLRDRL